MAELWPSLFTGITKRRGTGLILLWLVIGLLFYFLYVTARRSVLNEIRAQAMGVAISIAAGIEPEDVEKVRGPEDMNTEAFIDIQRHLDRVSRMSKDIRYAYLMRRDTEPDARLADFRYVVDQPARDDNGNGTIDEDEISETSGNPYDASAFPAMQEAWDHPAADDEITPDPPYPDLISGYAPIKDKNNRTVAIVGADITAPTVQKKYFAVQAVNLLGGILICFLVTLVVQLYYQQKEALEHNQRLSSELTSRNEMLRAANAELSRHNEQFESELKLAQHVQLGFLPKTFPRQDRIVFDKFYLTCDILGGDLFDVFSVDDDHVALYMADVSGHGVSAALISGLLKMAVTSVRDRSAIATGHLHADLLQPNRVLTTLNEMLAKEIPDYEFITMLYAVLDLSNDVLLIASAGHPAPLIFEARSGEASACLMHNGMALGLASDQEYPLAERPIREGDKILFYTDGLIEAMNTDNEEFSEERVLKILRENGRLAPADLIAALRSGIDHHRGTSAVSDDFSLLIAELK